ncbi:hypothetical protein SSS_04870 [Sarcoptes scabiei]|uniref:Uncharacterized protein n=1 Tax=Sarcoptes scabiei TaxID=52283 RepID=A0A834RHC1_SARSC|nr:hypothetical protein SSS_04870 [Sarcoptes scabiei]
MPRIGRSSASSNLVPGSQTTFTSSSQQSSYPALKRQSLIPAPRIGRRDQSNGGNYETIGAMGKMNENLMEPLDIQLRAAFIPRLGKRNNGSPDRMDSNGAAEVDKIFNSLRSKISFPKSSSQIYSNVDDDEENSVDDEDEFGRISNRLPYNSFYSREWQPREINFLDIAPYLSRSNRAVFAPRIGKKAAFVPRIG